MRYRDPKKESDLFSMIDESDEAVFAGSAYQSEASEAYLMSKDCRNFILFKGRRGHPLSEEEQATTNSGVASAFAASMSSDE